MMFLMLLCFGLFVVVTIGLAFLPIAMNKIEESNYMVMIQKANFNHKVKQIEKEEKTMLAAGLMCGRKSNEY